jgi:peroxiredoxin
VLQHTQHIAALDAVVLLVAYDTPSLLAAKLLRGLDVPYQVLLDADKRTYQAWGLGRSTPWKSFLSPSLTWRYVKLLLQGERFLGFAPDMLQLGGDFVVDRSGRISFAHAMHDNGDRATVAEVLGALERIAQASRS